MIKPKNYNTAVLFLLLISFYLICILIVPGYFIDDYFIYTEVESGNGFLSGNPDGFCYLFYRPVYFFIATLEYFVTGGNPVIMKAVSALLLTSSLIMVFSIAGKIPLVFKLGTDRTALILLIAAAGFHTSFVFDVLWLSAKNELIMMLFLLLSVNSVLQYLLKKKNYYLILFLIFFTASLLSKQQAVVIPACMLAVFFMRKDLIGSYPKALKAALWLAFTVSLLYSVFMYFSLMPGHSYFLENIWKKPFVVAASLLYAASPAAGDIVYPFFLQNKIIAVFALAVILSAVFLLMRKPSDRMKLINIVRVIAVYILTMLPVLFISFSERLITVQIIFLLLVVPFITVKQKIIRRFYHAVLMLVIAINIFHSAVFAGKMASYSELDRQSAGELERIKQDTGGNVIVVSDMDLDTPYKTCFFNNNRFCRDSGLLQVPVFFQPVFDYRQFDIVNNQSRVFSARFRGDTLEVTSESEDYSVAVNHKILKDDFNSRLELAGTESHHLKFFKSVKFLVKDWSWILNNRAVFFNGIEWEVVR